jgi:hypothetical protein
MSQKWSALIGIFTVIFSAGLLLFLSSCGHDQELIAITVQPPTETFGAPNIPLSQDAGLNVNLRAYGSYIHPPVTKEITNQVTWSSNTPQMVTVDAAGTITATGNACGNTLVSATMPSSHGGIQVGFMTATVVCFTGTGPTGPTGIACSLTCGFIFNTGSTVMLIASPTAPSTSATWTAGCDTISGNTCTVTMNANRTVAVQFQ